MTILLLATLNACLLALTGLSLLYSAHHREKLDNARALQRETENQAVAQRFIALAEATQSQSRALKRIEYLYQQAERGEMENNDTRLAQQILSNGGSANDLQHATGLNKAEIDLLLQLQMAKARGTRADIH